MMKKLHILWYLLRVRLALTGSRKQKKQILTILEASALAYASDQPNVDYRTLAERFGAPQKIAESCVAEMEPEELLAEMQIRQKVLLVITCTATLLLIMRFGFGIASYLSFEKRMNGYAVVEIIEVENTIYEDGSEPK